MAVIYRGSASPTLLEVQLHTFKIPYEKRGGVKFFEKETILDMVALMDITQNPYNVISWYRAMQLQYEIGETRATTLSKQCTKPNFLTDNSYKPMKSVTQKIIYPQLVELNEVYMRAQNITRPEEMIRYFGEYYIKKIDDHLKFIKQKEAKSEQQIELLNTLMQASKSDFTILQQLAKPYQTINHFLDALLLDGVDDTNKEKEKPKVILTTIHSAKGLEWDNVYIMDCKEEIFPCLHSRFENKRLEEYQEELRCFYVAMTRAKKNLFFMYPKYRNLYGRPCIGELSSFLSEATKTFDIIDETNC